MKKQERFLNKTKKLDDNYYTNYIWLQSGNSKRRMDQRPYEYDLYFTPVMNIDRNLSILTTQQENSDSNDRSTYTCEHPAIWVNFQ